MLFDNHEGTMNATTLIRFARPETEQRDQPTYTTLPRPGTSRRSTSKTFSSPATTRIEKRRRRTRTFAEDPFRARFGHRLPTGMRQEARGMDWKTFTATYAPTTIRVDQLHTEKLRAGRKHFELTMSGLSRDGSATCVSITSMGASSAMTQILADHGYNVEILEFHQYKIFEATVTFIYTMHHSQRVWAIGFGADADLSIANALCAAATRLYGAK